ncbi:peptidoglycan-binding protein [Streptomyces sp. NBC_01304]|uniref:peptidoglycan-binding protein n=1 Tax=Streptomyces sp. NBC_01304 TaxID=2903818 RepID=UPI002E14D927|nr:peptidoglycan-binding protein [Streptomyces sp. NBC_01304]
MSSPLTPDALARALRDEGVRMREHGNWKTYNRNHKGSWGPVHGVMLHHTAGRKSLSLCRTGTPDLPGPLCIGLISKDGTVHLVGYGRTNHAGSGSTAVLDAVRTSRALPSRPGPDAVDGNARFYGFEIENLGDGHDPYPAAQLDAVERLSAAICRSHGWPGARVIGHKEWTRRKIDPSFSMPTMRTRIGARIGTTSPRPRYAPFPGTEFFTSSRRSALITALGRRLVAEGCGRYAVGPGPEWGEADRTSYAAWQRKLGYVGAAADGIPGRISWDKLRVPQAD